MTRTLSKMVPLGFTAPAFLLPDTISGNEFSLQDLKGDTGTVIMFICNHCPFVQHVNKELVKVSNKYIALGIGFIAISSNDIKNYPQDSPQLMKQVAKEQRYPFPYLYDESQQVAKSYNAVCTPDFFIFDNELKLVYRGQLDDSRPGNEITLTGKDIRTALDCLLEGNSIPVDQKPSIGCNIKWKIT